MFFFFDGATCKPSNPKSRAAPAISIDRLLSIAALVLSFGLDVELLKFSGSYQRMHPRRDGLSKVETQIQHASRALRFRVKLAVCEKDCARMERWVLRQPRRS